MIVRHNRSSFDKLRMTDFDRARPEFIDGLRMKDKLSW